MKYIVTNTIYLVMITAGLVVMVVSENVEAAGFGNIVFIGDSITEASSTKPVHGNGDYSWRYGLWKKFVDNGDTYQFVGSRTSNAHGSTSYPTYLGQTFPNRHEAIWGTWSQERYNTLHPYWGDLNRNGTNYAADAAFIFVGGNDSLTVTQVSGYLEGMVDDLQAANPNVTVYMLSIIPRYTSDTDGDGFRDLPDSRNTTQFTDINTNLQAFAATKTTSTSDVIYVDLFSLVQPNWLYDGIHPNSYGETQIASAVYAVMDDPGIVPPPHAAWGVINVDFNNDAADAYSGQGVYPDPGNNIWNQVNATGATLSSNIDLVASDGYPTPVDVAASYTGRHARIGYTNSLLRDGIVGVGDIKISGLDDSLTYDLTFYSTFDAFASTFTTDGQSAGVSGSPNSAPYQETFVLGKTYVTLYDVKTNGAGEIVVTVSNTYNGETGGTSKTFVTGFQIAVKSDITAPNPSMREANVPINKVLSWVAPSDPNIVSVESYTILLDPNEAFVTDGALDLVDYFDTIPGTQTSYDPVPDLATDTTYYWRVVAEVQYDYKTPGDVNDISSAVWSFTTVLTAPQITQQPLTTRVYPTDTDVVLACEFSSVSAATVQWYKDGKTLSTGGDIKISTTNVGDDYTTTLQVLTPAIADGGEYYCVINNGGEIVSDTAYLIINRLLAQYEFDGSLAPAVGSASDAPTGQGKSINGVDNANEWLASDVTLPYVTGVNGTGQAINLGSGQYVDFSTAGYPRASDCGNGIGEGLDAGTIVCWVKPDNTGDVGILVNYNSNPDPTGFGLTLSPYGTTARGRLYVRAKTEAGNPVDLAPALLGLSDRPGWNIYDGNWHMLAATWQAGDEANLYLDGQLVGTERTNTPAVYEPWQHGVLVGSSRGPGDSRHLLSGPLTGAVDNLRIYNYRLDVDSNEVFAQEYYDNTGVLPCMEIHFSGNEFNVDNTGSSYCKVDLSDIAEFATAWLTSGLLDVP
ncbi:MAG: GDSL-type esterase/lipase family protein [Anaerohalosphaeraceae bacterium]